MNNNTEADMNFTHRITATQEILELPYKKGPHPGSVCLDINGDNTFDLGVWGEDYNGGYIRVDSEFLHKLADLIKENVPEPVNIEGHMFVWGTPADGPREPLVRDGEFWYASDNVGYTTRAVNELYTDLEVIR